MRLFLTFFACIFLYIPNLFANDTTDLYQRVQTIKELSEWLKKNAKSEIENNGKYYQADSATNIQYKVFESALSKYFNKLKIDSIIKVSDTGNLRIGPSLKYRVVNGLIAHFNELAHIVDTGSLNFKMYSKDDIHILIDEEIDSINSVIQYFLIEGEIIPYLLFTFETGSSKLFWIDVSVLENQKRQKLTKYFETLQKKKELPNAF
jgi:hypothetical protein